MAAFEIENLALLKSYEGREFPATDWFVVSQDRIQKFADATEDHQWIHLDATRAERETSFGGTIAHGFLTVSLLPYFLRQAIQIRSGLKMTVNYGLNKVRFPSARMGMSLYLIPMWNGFTTRKPPSANRATRPSPAG